MQTVFFEEVDGIGYLRVLNNAVRNDYSGTIKLIWHMINKYQLIFY